MSTVALPQSRRWLMGLYFFLASLAVLFFSAVLAVLLVRSSDLRSEPPLPIELPLSLWWSLPLLVVISGAQEWGLSAVKRERQAVFCQTLVIAWLGVALFLVSQTIGLTELLARHNEAPSRDPRSYGLVYALVALHAVHVVGGIPPLALVTWRGLRGDYDHECHTGVKGCAIYWHFLGVVWLSLLGTFTLMRGG